MLIDAGRVLAVDLNGAERVGTRAQNLAQAWAAPPARSFHGSWSLEECSSVRPALEADAACWRSSPLIERSVARYSANWRRGLEP